MVPVWLGDLRACAYWLCRLFQGSAESAGPCDEAAAIAAGAGARAAAAAGEPLRLLLALLLLLLLLACFRRLACSVTQTHNSQKRNYLHDMRSPWRS